MSNILSVASSFPAHRATVDEIRAAATEWLSHEPNSFQLFDRMLTNAHTATRHFIFPPKEVIRERGQAERAKIFEEHAVTLGADVARKAIERAGLRVEDVDCVIFSSCSCPIIPAPDTLIIQELGISPQVQRIPAYQFGCAGGVIALGLATKLTASFQNILCINVEICSLVFQRGNTEKSQLVGASIFGDGAAAAIISKHSQESVRARIRGSQSELLNHSRDLMGYDIHDNGPHLRLARNLPAALGEEVRSIVDSFLAKHERTRSDIPWWLFHPGGTKVLDTLEEKLEVDSEQCRWSHETLATVGNLSSATVMVVLERFLASTEVKRGDLALMLGIGPGLTVEQLLIEVV